MKRYSMLVLVLVLVCAVFTGCRRNDMGPLSPTNEATTNTPSVPVTVRATRPATEPSTHVTESTTHSTEITNPTDSTNATEATQSRSGGQQDSMR